MSGGGAFTEDGVFVGILCGGDEEGKVAVVPYSMIETVKAPPPDIPGAISPCSRSIYWSKSST